MQTPRRLLRTRKKHKKRMKTELRAVFAAQPGKKHHGRTEVLLWCFFVFVFAHQEALRIVPENGSIKISLND